jgi:hypothetical protein
VNVTPARRFVRPAAGDSFEAIARQQLAGVPVDEATANLRAWNPHLTMRRGDFLLVSDVVFIEP